jgi:hypothetical protein
MRIRVTLDRNGFALVCAPTRVNNFYSPNEVKSVYYPEVKRLLQEQLGASRVFAFDHVVRDTGLPDGRTPSRQVLHNDHTVNSAPRRVRDHLRADAQELLKHRFGAVMSGGRSEGRSSIHRLRCATREASPTTI